ncbi:MAG: fatty acyl-AMP ligase, partial [Sinobacteraceae bacterium]|nr:fatty acyl-AMP ligase [Nevskiaceae bacterium]
RRAFLAHLRQMIEAASADAVIAPQSFSGWVSEACEGLKLRFAGPLSALPTAPAGGASVPGTTPEALAYLQFSSGSTRFPRGAAVTQAAIMANTHGIVHDGLQAGDGDRCTNWLPMYHDMGLVGFMLAPLSCHISVDYLPTDEFGRRPLTWLHLISRNRATLSYSPSFGYGLCARRANRGAPDTLDLSSWRVAGIGGDMIRPDVLQRFSDTFAGAGFDARAWVASYGMAEASLALSFAPLNSGLRVDVLDSQRLEADNQAWLLSTAAGRRSRAFVHCGPILPHHEVQIRDAAGRTVAEHQVGTIFVRGPSLMREYFGDPLESARVLSADGWLNTGDLGYLNGGEIVITGRAKDLIILNGRNIWPQDLEWTIEAEVAGLRSGSVAAFAIDAEPADEVVILIERRSRDDEALRIAAAAALRSHHGVGAKVVLVGLHSLPRTSSGKLSRAKARQCYLSGELDDQRVGASA